MRDIPKEMEQGAAQTELAKQRKMSGQLRQTQGAESSGWAR